MFFDKTFRTSKLQAAFVVQLLIFPVMTSQVAVFHLLFQQGTRTTDQGKFGIFLTSNK